MASSGYGCIQFIKYLPRKQFYNEMMVPQVIRRYRVYVDATLILIACLEIAFIFSKVAFSSVKVAYATSPYPLNRFQPPGSDWYFAHDATRRWSKGNRLP